jgi:hypothetical protein
MAVTLAGRLRTQSGECARLGSPLYAELLARAAEDVEAGGVVAEAFAGRERLEGSFLPAERLPVLALADGHGPPVRWWPEGPVALSPPPR